MILIFFTKKKQKITEMKPRKTKEKPLRFSFHKTFFDCMFFFLLPSSCEVVKRKPQKKIKKISREKWELHWKWVVCWGFFLSFFPLFFSTQFLYYELSFLYCSVYFLVVWTSWTHHFQQWIFTRKKEICEKLAFVFGWNFIKREESLTNIW